MTVKELKELLEKVDDNAKIFLNYTCNDTWYDYYGSDIEVVTNKKRVEIVVSN